MDTALRGEGYSPPENNFSGRGVGLISANKKAGAPKATGQCE
ncbi:hypothetical protein [Hymenobacter jeollabukensis]